MSTILLATLKVAFLVLMWVFILFVTNVIRVDLFGRRVTAEELVAADGQTAPQTKDSAFSGLRKRKAGAGTTPTATPTRVTIRAGKGAGSSAVLPEIGQEIFLGRASTCDLEIDDDYASSKHAKIWRDEQGFVVEDLLSTNGTYVNGQRISQPTRIDRGDTVRIGRSQMQLDG
ncbi:MAG: FHA domain-containing protein [Propionibacterium sp.]|nr:FHA domain-containing protein [Propionibacterium sp.]